MKAAQVQSSSREETTESMKQAAAANEAMTKSRN